MNVIARLQYELAYYDSDSRTTIPTRVLRFSSMVSAKYSLFLFDELCKVNLVFTFLPMSPSMMRTLCLGMLRTREDSSLRKMSRSVSSLVLVGL